MSALPHPAPLPEPCHYCGKTSRADAVSCLICCAEQQGKALTPTHDECAEGCDYAVDHLYCTGCLTAHGTEWHSFPPEAAGLLALAAQYATHGTF